MCVCLCVCTCVCVCVRARVYPIASNHTHNTHTQHTHTHTHTQVPTVRGTAVLHEDDDPEFSTVLIKRADGGEELATCRKLIFATGSSPMRVPTIPYDDVRIFDSDSIRSLKFLPKSLVCVCVCVYVCLCVSVRVLYVYTIGCCVLTI